MFPLHSLWWEFLSWVKVLVAQSCPPLCNSMNYSPSGSSAYGILQARILEWVVIFPIQGWMCGCWISSNAFSASVKMIMWFFSFLLLLWCITLFDLYTLNHPCDPGVNPTWPWCMVLLFYLFIFYFYFLYGPFNILLDSVCSYLVEDFCIYIHQRYWPLIFFLCSV